MNAVIHLRVSLKTGNFCYYLSDILTSQGRLRSMEGVNFCMQCGHVRHRLDIVQSRIMVVVHSFPVLTVNVGNSNERTQNITNKECLKTGLIRD